ncbi:MAG: OB-fold nucleic acid binding domain-containing protein, partial [Verrucomicrobiota bacterium]
TKERVTFVEGCKQLNKIPEKQANAIFDFLEKFAAYGFNKSHSAAYALIAYQTAYLKANYPVEFMAGLLSNAVNNTEKITILVAECARMEIAILPPDINVSGLSFLPEQVGSERGIRFGLAAVKNVGAAAMQSAIAERAATGPFKSLEDFCSRLDSRSVNKKILESLVKCGAFDFDARHRAELFEAIEPAMAAASSIQRDRASGQVSLFDSMEDFAPAKKANPSSHNNLAPWPNALQLSYEKELLGFYVTGHPLDDYQGTLEKGKFTPLTQLSEITEPTKEKVAGLVSTLEKKFTKKEGKAFGIFLLEDYSGSIEATMWNEDFVQFESLLQPGTAISCTLKIIPRDGNIRVIASDVKALSPLPSKKSVRLLLDRSKLKSETLLTIQKIIQAHPGLRPVILEIVDAQGNILTLKTDKEFSIGDERAVKKALENLS